MDKCPRVSKIRCICIHMKVMIVDLQKETFQNNFFSLDLNLSERDDVWTDIRLVNRFYVFNVNILTHVTRWRHTRIKIPARVIIVVTFR